MSVSIGFAVIADDKRTPQYAAFLSEQDEGKGAEELSGYGSPPEEIVIATRTVTVEDEEGQSSPQLASALAAVYAINRMCDDPHALDLLARIFFEGFTAGAAYKESRLRAELGISPPTP